MLELKILVFVYREINSDFHIGPKWKILIPSRNSTAYLLLAERTVETNFQGLVIVEFLSLTL